MREARAAAQLRHPGIVSTHEVGRDGDTLYIVNEYVRGVPLSELISDHRLGIREAVLMVTELADALEHAHVAGVIHRDIKPSNVLVDDHGRPHVTDFGLAKRNENEITMTTEGRFWERPRTCRRNRRVANRTGLTGEATFIHWGWSSSNCSLANCRSAEQPACCCKR